MATEQQEHIVFPSEEQVASELNRIRYRRRFIRTLLNTVAVLIVAAAAAVLISTVFMPVIQISGDSMNPTLRDGDILVTLNTDNVSRGDLCCVSWQNKMLVKRVIGLPGDTVEISEDGSVSVNGSLLDEPYVSEKSLGQCDAEFPYEVPEDTIFILGDNRLMSVDSRSSDIGCIGKDQIVGRVLFRVWPFRRS